MLIMMAVLIVLPASRYFHTLTKKGLIECFNFKNRERGRNDDLHQPSCHAAAFAEAKASQDGKAS